MRLRNIEIKLIKLVNNLLKILVFSFLFVLQYGCGQGREYKINTIIDSLGIVENQKYWYFDIRIEPLKYEATQKDSINLIEIENLLTEEKIRKKIINAFYDIFTDNEINDMYNFVISSAYYKFFKSSTFNNNISNQFKDINEMLDKIDHNIKNHNIISKFEPIPVEREDGFYITIDYDSNMDNKYIILEKNPVITKDDILECKKDDYEISITFNENGAKKLYIITKNNIGKPIAIVIDKNIVSIPIVNSAISGGSLNISGNFTEEEIEKIIRKLNK
jgi:hypothetical protein